MSFAPLTDTTTGRASKWDATDSAAHVQLSSGTFDTLNRIGAGSLAGYVQASNSAGQTIKSGPGAFYGIQVISAGTTPTLTVYDNTSATGTVLFTVPTASLTAGTIITFAGIGVLFTTGMHVVIGNAGGTTTINFLVV